MTRFVVGVVLCNHKPALCNHRESWPRASSTRTHFLARSAYFLNCRPVYSRSSKTMSAGRQPNRTDWLVRAHLCGPGGGGGCAMNAYRPPGASRSHTHTATRRASYENIQTNFRSHSAVHGRRRRRHHLSSHHRSSTSPSPADGDGGGSRGRRG